MDIHTYVWCAITGLLGIAFQTLIKLSAMKKQSESANRTFSYIAYFSNDWLTIALNLITLALAIIAVDELIKYQPKVLAFIKWFFFFIGYTGSSLLNFLLNKTQKSIDAVIDVKTDVGDGKLTAEEGAIKLNAIENK